MDIHRFVSIYTCISLRTSFCWLFSIIMHIYIFVCSIRNNNKSSLSQFEISWQLTYQGQMIISWQLTYQDQMINRNLMLMQRKLIYKGINKKLKFICIYICVLFTFFNLHITPPPPPFENLHLICKYLYHSNYHSNKKI